MDLNKKITKAEKVNIFHTVALERFCEQIEMGTNWAWGQIGRQQVGHWGNLAMGTSLTLGQIGCWDKLAMGTSMTSGQIGCWDKLGVGTNLTWEQIGHGDKLVMGTS